MPLQLTRSTTPTGHRLTLHLPGGCVVVELTVRGLELDAATVERMLHAPMGVIATLGCTDVGAGRETI